MNARICLHVLSAKAVTAHRGEARQMPKGGVPSPGADVLWYTKTSAGPKCESVEVRI